MNCRNFYSVVGNRTYYTVECAKNIYDVVFTGEMVLFEINGLPGTRTKIHSQIIKHFKLLIK